MRTAGDVPLLRAALEPQAGVGPRREVPRQKPDKSRALPRTPRSARPGRGSAARGVWLSHGPLGVVVRSFGPALSELHSPPASAVRLWPLPAPATGNRAAPSSEALGRFPPSPCALEAADWPAQVEHLPSPCTSPVGRERRGSGGTAELAAAARLSGGEVLGHPAEQWLLGER